MSDFSFIPPTSVVTIPGAHASAAFTSKTSEVFKEEHNIAPIIINDKMKYIPWGGDNQMPYNIIDLIESDETMSTCQMFNAEVCYGSGLVYDTELATAQVQAQVDDRLHAGQRPRKLLPRRVPGLQALRLLRQRDHPQ